jgi:hypothetical protein
VIYEHEVEERRARSSYDAGDRTMPTFAGPEYWEDFDQYLTNRGLSASLARHNLWYPSMQAGDGELRVVMPASPSALRHWQARAIDKGALKRYQSSHGARGPAVIIAWPMLFSDLAIVVVEGPMDALAAAEVGVIGVALLGNTPNREALDYIASCFPAYTAIVVPDKDSFAEAALTLTKLSSRGLNGTMKTTRPYKDLAEVPVNQRRAILGV